MAIVSGTAVVRETNVTMSRNFSFQAVGGKKAIVVAVRVRGTGSYIATLNTLPSGDAADVTDSASGTDPMMILSLVNDLPSAESGTFDVSITVRDASNASANVLFDAVAVIPSVRRNPNGG